MLFNEWQWLRNEETKRRRGGGSWWRAKVSVRPKWRRMRKREWRYSNDAFDSQFSCHFRNYFLKAILWWQIRALILYLQMVQMVQMHRPLRHPFSVATNVHMRGLSTLAFWNNAKIFGFDGQPDWSDWEWKSVCVQPTCVCVCSVHLKRM